MEKQLNCSEKQQEKNDIDSIMDLSSNCNLTPRFNLGRDLNCSEKQEKHDIDTRKSEDLNCLEKKSSTMEKSHSDEEKEEERMKWRIEDDEYVCYVCGLRGHKFLDYYSGCNQQFAHRYCAIKDAAADETTNIESLEAAKVIINNDSSEGKCIMSPLLSEFFKKLTKFDISVIDHFILKKHAETEVTRSRVLSFLNN